MFQRRRIIRSALFDTLGASIAGDVQRWDEMVEGLEEILSRRPTYYPAVDEDGDLRVAAAPFGGDCRVLVFYTVEDPGTEDEAVILQGAATSEN